MANTSAVYARVDTELKDSAESILSQLGISPSGAIHMLYRQIVMHNGLPFDLKLPTKQPLALGSMTREQLDRELVRGLESVESDKVMTAEEFDSVLANELGI
ncbi:MAG: type II toxin-antitoxin system RelB/DinJ family antitoxin [Atopobiaceae bacterium]|nr:type II toxin-antitoxin system RelB/DinJ family antitoxin [Atopobiaceae bacterium]